MKKNNFIIGVLFLFISLGTFAQSDWGYNFENALKLSKVLNKPILVDFMATWCGPCKMMDRDVWSEDDIKALKSNFIPVKIDIDQYSNIASKYSVIAIPNVMILDSYGNKLYGSLGYKKKSEISKLLTNFSINLTSINRSMLILEKSKKNVYSNIRVGQKFQDASIFLKGDVHKSFLLMSNDYLKNAEKIKEIKPVVYEKIKLLKLLNKAYFHQSKSVLKAIKKKYKNVDATNLALLTYIKFYANYDLKHLEESKDLFAELQQTTNNTAFVQKANLILGKN
jgi:thiol-disulfide isomerase/thioredoxin